MRAKEFITELDADFVNSEIRKDKSWRIQGKGCTASVWQHIDDPHTVVKVVGGGTWQDTNDLHATIAFVHFCVDHGYKSKHFPIIHGINVDDPEVVQVRIEKLYPMDREISTLLSTIATAINKYGSAPQRVIDEFEDRLQLSGLIHNNSVNGIVDAIRLLADNSIMNSYKTEHSLQFLTLDLHAANWMTRADGTIVAVDPWVG